MTRSDLSKPRQASACVVFLSFTDLDRLSDNTPLRVPIGGDQPFLLSGVGGAEGLANRTRPQWDAKIVAARPHRPKHQRQAWTHARGRSGSAAFTTRARPRSGTGRRVDDDQNGLCHGFCE
jgi:hypothetical protein